MEGVYAIMKKKCHVILYSTYLWIMFFPNIICATTLCYQNTILLQNNLTDQSDIIVKEVDGEVKPVFSNQPYEFSSLKYPIGTLKDCIFQCEITVKYATQNNAECIVTLFLKQQKKSCVTHINVNTYEHCKAEAFSSGGVGGGELILMITQ